jgi:excisionase family DNA binding protein
MGEHPNTPVRGQEMANRRSDSIKDCEAPTARDSEVQPAGGHRHHREPGLPAPPATDDSAAADPSCGSFLRTSQSTAPGRFNGTSALRRATLEGRIAPVDRPGGRPEELPFLLTADETAVLLRTTRKAIYARAERGLLPGVLRDGRRLLVRRDDLLSWLDERRAASPGGQRR